MTARVAQLRFELRQQAVLVVARIAIANAHAGRRTATTRTPTAGGNDHRSGSNRCGVRPHQARREQ